jgi:hypothetical protein
MLDTDTKRRIDVARDILVDKAPDPKSQVEQTTFALIYEFMDDMDAEAMGWTGTRDILYILSIDVGSPFLSWPSPPLDAARRPCYTTPGLRADAGPHSSARSFIHPAPPGGDAPPTYRCHYQPPYSAVRVSIGTRRAAHAVRQSS